MRSRKKLGLWSALPPYLGGKRRLAPMIFREIDRLVPRRLWPQLTFLDAFMGGASISLFAKAQAFGRVIGTDLALRSVTIGQALVANNRVKLNKADVLRVLQPSTRGPGPIESNMVPGVFTREQARVIDHALSIASHTEEVSKAALLRLLAMRIALLAHPYSQIRKGTIHRMASGEYESITESAVYHYVDGLRLATVPKLMALAEQINGGVFEGCGEVHQIDIVEALPSIAADVLYADPPYANAMSYEREYRTLDQILEGVTRPTSPFSAKGGTAQIDRLLERAAHVPVIVLSFGNADCSLDELEGKMLRLGRQTKAIAIRYAHLPAVASAAKMEANREFLVVGWDPDAPLLRDLSVDRAGIGNHAGGGDVDRAVPGVHVDPDPGGPERPAAEPLIVDGLQEGDASVPEEVAPNGRGLPVAELQPGVNRPDAILAEAGLDGDGEGRVVTSSAHGPTVP